MKTDDLLIEIGTEELPPKALKKLAQGFASQMEQALTKAKLSFKTVQWYATPRRLALLISALTDQQPNQEIERRGPALNQAYDANGNPTPAALGFARSCQIEFSQVQTLETDKGAWLFYRLQQAGQSIEQLLPDMIETALKQLPIPKMMTWGNYDFQFTRPVRWLVLLYGQRVIPCKILGQQSSHQTYGHRFHHPQAITLNHPNDYLKKLETEGKVIADFAKRKQIVKQQVETLAAEHHAQVVIDEDLLEEVTAIVSWPVALLASFDKKFLQVPSEALITAMKVHQRCFYLLDKQQRLLPHFITVSNIESQNPQQVIAGNERVMRARLEDAYFFYEQDRKKGLKHFLEKLNTVLFQQGLGTLFDKSERMKSLAQFMATELSLSQTIAPQAAQLAKTDLMSEMVGEFPELQGTMGYYYALAENLNEHTAIAIKQHYQPRFAGDELPTTIDAALVALSDKLDTLIAIFGINKKPTGEKDPFALRRAALGVIRILIEKQLNLDLKKIIEFGISQFDQLPNKNLVSELLDFISERLKVWYHEQQIHSQTFLAVQTLGLTNLLDFNLRIIAVNNFIKLNEAAALSAANKRVYNLLHKQTTNDSHQIIEKNLLIETAEKNLVDAITNKQTEIKPLVAKADYQQVLTNLAELRPVVDQFFDQVMVMADDEKIKNNRIAILQQLRALFLQVADISQLSS